MICCVSPIYKGSQSDSYYESIKNLCEGYGVPYVYDGADYDISVEKNFFSDRTHMNDIGARYYTSKVITWIKEGIN